MFELTSSSLHRFVIVGALWKAAVPSSHPNRNWRDMNADMWKVTTVRDQGVISTSQHGRLYRNTLKAIPNVMLHAMTSVKIIILLYDFSF